MAAAICLGNCISTPADGVFALLFKQLNYWTIKAVEQQVTEHITSDNIFAINGKKALVGFFWMQCSIVINAIGKGFNIGSGLWLKLSLIARIQVIPNTQPVNQ